MSPAVSASARDSLLARLRSRAGQAPESLAHPIPGPLATVPIANSKLVDHDDLVGSFCANARLAGAVVHLVADSADPAAVAQVVADIVARHAVHRAVASKQHEAWPFVEQLGAAGVEVVPFEPAAAAAADLGVTVATGAIAATGTIAQRSDEVGGRTASLLPTTHLCVVPAGRIVAGSADLLRILPEAGLPSNFVLVTGPSKSGDIEQIIVTGVHGPVALELCVLLDR